MIFDLRRWELHLRKIDPLMREESEMWIEENGKRIKLE